MTSPFTKGDPTGAALVAWWHGLEQDRASRAQLRRCANLLEVMQTEAFHAARRQLVGAGMSEAESRSPRLAAVVALAAHVKSSSVESFVEACSAGEKPRVSPLRFRQLLEAADDDELFMRLRRLIPLIDSSANLPAFASSVWYWGDGVRKRWVFEYRWPTKQTI